MEGPEHMSDVDERPASQLIAGFSQTAMAVFAAGSVEDTLRKVVEVTVTTVEGCDFASIVLLDNRSVTTHVETEPIAYELDAMQQRVREGPSFDVIANDGSFYADNLANDARWTRFGPEATARGIRSMLALSLSTNGTLGVLNLYAQYPQAFGVIDRAKALILGTLASFALAEARSHEDEVRRADDLHAALATREVIGQAQGILMERERVTADQAFDILRRASQHLNRKLREVAQDLVESGESPQTGPAAPTAPAASP